MYKADNLLIANAISGNSGVRNLQRCIHAGGGRVLEQRKSTGVRIHTTPQVGADGKPAEAPHRRAHGDDYPLELRSSLTNLEWGGAEESGFALYILIYWSWFD